MNVVFKNITKEIIPIIISNALNAKNTVIYNTPREGGAKYKITNIERPRIIKEMAKGSDNKSLLWAAIDVCCDITCFGLRKINLAII